VGVAVVAVRVMQMPIHEIIDMIAVRHGLVPAARTMNMARLMTGAAMFRRADIRVRLRHLHHMLVDMVLMRVVQMTVMQIVDMVAMLHGGMAATRAMAVGVVVVVGLRTAAHRLISSSCPHPENGIYRRSAACSTALRIRLGTWSSARA
jgi:hypothetical protein